MPPPAPPAPPPLSAGRRRPTLPQSELDEEVEIEPERRRRILELYYALDDASHYELLGVEPSAEKKAIKDSYNELVKLVHPDMYFRKNIGSYKTKLELIFQRITEAQETLTRNQTRRDYDAELARKKPARKPSSAHHAVTTQQAATTTHSANLPVSKPASIPPPPLAASRSSAPSIASPVTPTPRPSAPAPRPLTPAIAPPPPISSTPPPSGGAARPAASSIPPGTSTTPPVSAAPPGFPQEPSSAVRRSEPPSEDRRRMLASRLSGKWAAAKTPSQPPEKGASIPPEPRPPPDPQAAASARDSLRRMAISHQVEQQRGQRDRYVAAARECMERGDPVGAANALRLALTSDPGNEALQAQLDEWSAKAAAAQVEHYLKLGASEAELGRWREAARAYTRAATGRPDAPDILDKAAHALVQAGGDLHLAADLARRAVGLREGEVRFRVTLVEVYLAAGLGLNARRELAEAARIEPANTRVKALLKRLG